MHRIAFLFVMIFGCLAAFAPTARAEDQIVGYKKLPDGREVPVWGCATAAPAPQPTAPVATTAAPVTPPAPKPAVEAKDEPDEDTVVIQMPAQQPAPAAAPIVIVVQQPAPVVNVQQTVTCTGGCGAQQPAATPAVYVPTQYPCHERVVTQAPAPQPVCYQQPVAQPCQQGGTYCSGNTRETNLSFLNPTIVFAGGGGGGSCDRRGGDCNVRRAPSGGPRSFPTHQRRCPRR